MGVNTHRPARSDNLRTHYTPYNTSGREGSGRDASALLRIGGGSCTTSPQNKHQVLTPPRLHLDIPVVRVARLLCPWDALLATFATIS